ncbi:MAG: acyl-CoA carboxylase subunit epsilon, partial [Actinomycetota bacterium]|nr:acyl-CoA carboxylase subunit epsilon [Actinomycetota bacterium]
MSTGGGDDRAPVLRIVRGTPDDVELAALVSVLAARAAGAAAGSELTGRPRSAWA